LNKIERWGKSWYNYFSTYLMGIYFRERYCDGGLST